MSALVAAVSLVLATAAVHVSGLYFLLRRLSAIGAQDLVRRGALFLLRVVLLLTLAIVMLHMIEVWIWAAFYRAAVGLDWPTAVHFSLGCYSTVGGERIVLPPQWRLLGGVEGMLGALMFGLSTAFLFAVFNEIHRRWRAEAE
jgi:voltage-gated potassium channel